MSWARSRLCSTLSLAAVSARGATTEGAARRGMSAWPAPQEPGMEYQDAVRTLNTLQTNASYLEQVKRQRSDPQAQLEAMEMYLARSGLQVEDLNRLNIIHVTGTKGKGSTCAFTERILRNYGLKTGFFSSPHMVQVRERIRINGKPISPELFTKHFWCLYNQLEEFKDDSHVSMPSYFRFLTLMAFHVFLQEKVDLAVVEVGIGGAFDCTNIIRKPTRTSSLVFSCISHALLWISQGRDPIFQPQSLPRNLLNHPTANSGASILREAAAIHVLVTGSLHLVGGVLKLLDPSMSQ